MSKTGWPPKSFSERVSADLERGHEHPANPLAPVLAPHDHRMQLPDAAVVFGKATDPSEQMRAVRHRSTSAGDSSARSTMGMGGCRSYVAIRRRRR